MADVIHHAGLLRGGIHNGNPGAVVEDRMTFLIGQGVAVQVDFDIPAFRDHHVFSQVLIQCNGVQPFVGVFVIRLRSVDGRTDGVIFRRPAVLFHGNGGLLQKNDLLKRHLIRHRGAAIFRDFLPGGVLYTVFRRLRIPFILSVTGGQFRIPVTGLKVLFSLLLFLRIVWLLSGVEGSLICSSCCSPDSSGGVSSSANTAVGSNVSIRQSAIRTDSNFLFIFSFPPFITSL